MKSPLSSRVTIATLVASAILIYFLPPFFTTPPANLKTFTFFFTTVAITLFFLITSLRRHKLAFNFSPLILPLLLLILITPIHSFTTHYPALDLISTSGLFLAFALTAIFSSTLVKINNNQIVITSLITIASLAAIISLLVFFNILPSTFADALYTPSLNLFLLILGLTAICAQFFKKTKFKLSQLAFLPLILLGLIFNLAVQFRAPSSEAPFLTILTQNLTTSPFYSLSTLSNLLFILVLLFLFYKTLRLTFNSTEPHHHLYFILLISFVVQLFTPIYPLVLLLQAILIACATNKNKQTLLNFNFATILNDKDHPTTTENRDGSRAICFSFTIILFILLICATARLSQSYLGFFYHQLAQNNSQNPPIFYIYSQQAVNIAPFIDVFQRSTAAANAEMMLQSIAADPDRTQTTSQQELMNAALKHAQAAISLNPSADNYLTLAQIHRAIIPYLADEASVTSAQSSVINAYSQALRTDPHNSDILLALGGFYQDIGDIDDALILYQTVITNNPTSIAAFYQLGTLYEQKGESSQALDAYQNALSLIDNQNPNYQENSALLTTKINALNTL